MHTFELEHFLPYRLSLLSNTVSQGIAETYRNVFGLSLTEWRVVAILGRFPGLTASEVVSRGAMDKVTVSRAVKKLQERKLIDRLQDGDDRRRMTLNLSAAHGMPLFQAVVPKALAYEQSLLQALEGEELEQLDSLMKKLQSAAEALNSSSSSAA